MEVKKAVIVAAGWGTRFLPATKSVPKEMLPLLDEPIIKYSLDEISRSGIKQIIIITAKDKKPIKDYFTKNRELERFLEQKGKSELLRKIRKPQGSVEISYIEQKERLGLGNAVLMAKEMVGNEPFAVLLPDDIISAGVPAVKQMLGVFNEYGKSVIAIEKVARQDVVHYGVIEPQEIKTNLYRVKSLVEKPAVSEAPSDLGIVGRYILTPQIFKAIEKTEPDKNGEIQLTDALKLLLKEQGIYAYRFKGKRFDTGTPLGYLKTQLYLGLRNPELKNALKRYIKELIEPEPTDKKS